MCTHEESCIATRRSRFGPGNGVNDERGEIDDEEVNFRDDASVDSSSPEEDEEDATEQKAYENHFAFHTRRSLFMCENDRLQSIALAETLENLDEGIMPLFTENDCAICPSSEGGKKIPILYGAELYPCSRYRIEPSGHVPCSRYRMEPSGHVFKFGCALNAIKWCSTLGKTCYIPGRKEFLFHGGVTLCLGTYCLPSRSILA